MCQLPPKSLYCYRRKLGQLFCSEKFLLVNEVRDIKQPLGVEGGPAREETKHHHGWKKNNYLDRRTQVINFHARWTTTNPIIKWPFWEQYWGKTFSLSSASSSHLASWGPPSSFCPCRCDWCCPRSWGSASSWRWSPFASPSWCTSPPATPSGPGRRWWRRTRRGRAGSPAWRRRRRTRHPPRSMDH